MWGRGRSAVRWRGLSEGCVVVWGVGKRGSRDWVMTGVCRGGGRGCTDVGGLWGGGGVPEGCEEVVNGNHGEEGGQMKIPVQGQASS